MHDSGCVDFSFNKPSVRFYMFVPGSWLLSHCISAGHMTSFLRDWGFLYIPPWVAMSRFDTMTVGVKTSDSDRFLSWKWRRKKWKKSSGYPSDSKGVLLATLLLEIMSDCIRLCRKWYGSVGVGHKDLFPKGGHNNFKLFPVDSSIGGFTYCNSLISPLHFHHYW